MDTNQSGRYASELSAALAACKPYFYYVGLFSMAINILMLVPALYMLQVYDRVVTSGSLSTLAMLTLILIFLLSAMGGLEWVRSRILVRASNNLEQLLRERVFNAAFKQSIVSAGLKSSAQPISDLTGLRHFLTGSGLFAFFDAPWFPIYVAVMFLFHPWFGWIAVFSGVVLVGIAFLNERLTSARLQQANHEAAWVNNYTTLNLRNSEVIESMGMLAGVRNRWNRQADRVLALQSDASDWAGILQAASKTFRIVVQSLVLGLGALLAVKQQISPGMMIAGSILLGRALAPIDQLLAAWRGFSTARAQFNRLNTILTQIPAESVGMPLPSPKGEISVEGVVVLSPQTRSPILKGINFSLKQGESLGVIGHSAAGKTTLARMLLGIWAPMAGKVRLDGAEISSWKREELGPYLGYLPQDIELFDGTIAENIARFGQVDSELVIEAARMAGVHDLILHLPNGYDTAIGNSGGSLSAGQRQRIGLARALYGKPCLVVLDEPNSNLDDAGENELIKTIQRIKANGITLVVIAHRPAILLNMDKILVLKEGSVLDFGSREQVLGKYMQPAGIRPASMNAQQSMAGNQTTGGNL